MSKSMKVLKIFTFASGFCLCNSFANIRGWIQDAYLNDLGMGCLRSAPLKGNVKSRLVILLESGYSSK